MEWNGVVVRRPRRTPRNAEETTVHDELVTRYRYNSLIRVFLCFLFIVWDRDGFLIGKEEKGLGRSGRFMERYFAG